MVYTLPGLDYEYSALEPFIDTKTMEIHHSKHHATYIQKLNSALEGSDLFGLEIEELLANDLKLVPDKIKIAVRNNGGGHFNHSFFWESMTSEDSLKVFEGEVAEAIKDKFGSFEDFKKKFIESALSRFGSGWVWLILNKDKELEIISSANQDSPIMTGNIPLLGLDVWEHAYYLKYQNKRADYAEAFFNVINWDKVNQRFVEN